MHTGLTHAFLLTLVGTLSLAPGHAQTPEVVLAMKLTNYRQTSATQLDPIEYLFGVAVEFPAAVPATTTVRLTRSGASPVTLTRDEDGGYLAEQSFLSQAALDAAFPDTNYTVTVSGGGTTWNGTFRLTTPGPSTPSRILNFADLQTVPDPRPGIRWETISSSAAGVLRVLTVAVTGPGGEDFAVRDPGGPYSTWTAIEDDLPHGVTVTGDLTYLVFGDPVELPGQVAFSAGRGFNVTFPITHRMPAPRIALQPKDAIVAGGADVFLDFGVWMSELPAGTEVTYQWFKDGVAVPGATTRGLALPDPTAGDAGSYHVEASTAGGTVRSATAQVVVGPGLAITRLAGGGGTGSGDGTVGTATFDQPSSMAMDAAGNLYVLDGAGTTIRKITPGGVVTTLAGTPGQRGSADGIGAAARFNEPFAIAVDAAGNVYVSDTGNHVIRRVSVDGVVTTVAGAAGVQDYVDGPAAVARFESPRGIAVDSDGIVYVVDHRVAGAVRRIAPDGVVSTLAGGQLGTNMDGRGTSAGFLFPSQLVMGQDGHLYVWSSAQKLRRVTVEGEVSTPGFSFYSGLYVVDREGNVFFSDGNAVRYVQRGASSQPVAGDISGDRDGFGAAAQFGGISGLLLAGNGDLYITEAFQGRIRKGVFRAGVPQGGATIVQDPQPQGVAVGSTFILTAAGGGMATWGRWARDGVMLERYEPMLIVRDAQPSDAGAYTYYASNAAGGVTSAPAAVTVTATNSPGRITNMSIRSATAGGAETLIVGLSLSGAPAPATRRLLLRAVGPTLASYDVAGGVPDPILSVFGTGGLLQSNDDWTAELAPTFSSTGAFPLPPGSRDAALGLEVASGTYTAQVSGKGVSGVALAEIYDAEANAAGLRLVNVSARTQVGRGENVLIAGFAITGTTAKTVLVRGVGPTLARHGLPASACLADPQLELFASHDRLAANDNWAGDPQTSWIMREVYAFDFASWDSKDAALMITLRPGTYTVKVSGVGDTTGIALVEVYEVP